MVTKNTQHEKRAPNKMGSPLYYDNQPPRMKRTVGSGKSGDNFSIPNTAKYGTGEGTGDAPTRMDRKVPKGKTGNNFSIPNAGPAKASRKDTGANSQMGKGYGVNGVKCDGGGYPGKGDSVGGAKGHYGGS